MSDTLPFEGIILQRNSTSRLDRRRYIDGLQETQEIAKAEKTHSHLTRWRPSKVSGVVWSKSEDLRLKGSW